MVELVSRASKPHSLTSARLRLAYVPNSAAGLADRSGQFHLGLQGCDIGTVSLVGKTADEATIGYEIAPQFRRQGLASEAVGAVTKAAASFGLSMLSAHCRSDNAASRGVLEHNGFTLTASTPWQVNGDAALMYMVYQWHCTAPGASATARVP